MLADFCARVGDCTTFDELRHVFAAEVARHGYTASACRIMEPATLGPRAFFAFREWPEDWAALSDRRNFNAKSFVLAELHRRIAPFTWSDIVLSRRLDSREQETFDAARAWGWADGFVLPIHGPDGYAASVSMASRERDLDLSPKKRTHLRMLALLAHDRSRTLVERDSTPPREILSARELECLRWVAVGKTDWEIGMILGLSPATIKFHLDRARGKLGTRTRAQAVARLALSGLA